MTQTRWIPKLTREEQERRRLLAGNDLMQGMAQADVAKKYHIHPSSVCRWKKIIAEKGIDGLQSKKTPGAQKKLTSKQEEQLVEAITEGPVAYGYSTDLWTIKRVAKLIRDKFGVTYNTNYVGELLHRLGFSPQKPRRVASERNDDERRTWVRDVWAESKKNSTKGIS